MKRFLKSIGGLHDSIPFDKEMIPIVTKLNEKGYKTFHLGGGVGSGEDNLYKFKTAFNKNSDYQFSIGKEIFDQEKYDELVALRAKQDPDFNPESKFFPLYRS